MPGVCLFSERVRAYEPMPKFLIRIIALLLLPCLSADPAWAYLPIAASRSPIEQASLQNPFLDQALTARFRSALQIIPGKLSSLFQGTKPPLNAEGIAFGDPQYPDSTRSTEDPGARELLEIIFKPYKNQLEDESADELEDQPKTRPFEDIAYENQIKSILRSHLQALDLPSSLYLHINNTLGDVNFHFIHVNFGLFKSGPHYAVGLNGFNGTLVSHKTTERHVYLALPASGDPKDRPFTIEEMSVVALHELVHLAMREQSPGQFTTAEIDRSAQRYHQALSLLLFNDSQAVDRKFASVKQRVETHLSILEDPDFAERDILSTYSDFILLDTRVLEPLTSRPAAEKGVDDKGISYTEIPWGHAAIVPLSRLNEPLHFRSQQYGDHGPVNFILHRYEDRLFLGASRAYPFDPFTLQAGVLASSEGVGEEMVVINPAPDDPEGKLFIEQREGAGIAGPSALLDAGTHRPWFDILKYAAVIAGAIYMGNAWFLAGAILPAWKIAAGVQANRNRGYGFWKSLNAVTFTASDFRNDLEAVPGALRPEEGLHNLMQHLSERLDRRGHPIIAQTVLWLGVRWPAEFLLRAGLEEIAALIGFISRIIGGGRAGRLSPINAWALQRAWHVLSGRPMPTHTQADVQDRTYEDQDPHVNTDTPLSLDELERRAIEEIDLHYKESSVDSYRAFIRRQTEKTGIFIETMEDWTAWDHNEYLFMRFLHYLRNAPQFLLQGQIANIMILLATPGFFLLQMQIGVVHNITNKATQNVEGIAYAMHTSFYPTIFLTLGAFGFIMGHSAFPIFLGALAVAARFLLRSAEGHELSHIYQTALFEEVRKKAGLPFAWRDFKNQFSQEISVLTIVRAPPDREKLKEIAHYLFEQIRQYMASQDDPSSGSFQGPQQAEMRKGPRWRRLFQTWAPRSKRFSIRRAA
jgi:hypothetical protein